MRRFCITALLCLLTAPYVSLKAADIYVNGTLMADGEVHTQPFCLNEQPIEFSVATYVYGACTDSIVWDFGDGTSAISTYTGTGEIKVTHTYTTQNWYTILAHSFCKAEDTDEWTTFSIRVVGAQDTIVTLLHPDCFTKEYYEAHQAECDALLASGRDSIGEHQCFEPVPMYHFEYCVENWDCIQLDVQQDVTTVCANEDLVVGYTKQAGIIEEATFIVGDIVAPVSIPSDDISGTITLPTHLVERAGRYQGELRLSNNACEEPLSIAVPFTVLYPENIFRFKFNNVLAVYKPGYGGNIGYEFVAYQWYLNGRAISGATESVYCHPEPFQPNDEVYVILTEQNGLRLPSCTQVLTEIPDYEPTSNQAPAQKKLLHQRIVIQIGDATYDIYGQRVE